MFSKFIHSRQMQQWAVVESEQSLNMLSILMFNVFDQGWYGLEVPLIIFYSCIWYRYLNDLSVFSNLSFNNCVAHDNVVLSTFLLLFNPLFGHSFWLHWSLWFVFSEPKGQTPQRHHESKANFPNSDYYSKDASQTKFSSHGEHRQQRNDRPPRFHRDADFPKPGQEPLSNCTTPQTSAQSQQWKGQEKWSRGSSDRPQNDRREMRDDQTFPSSFTTTFTRSKEPPQQMEISGSYQQRSRNGDGGVNLTGPSHRRGLKDNAPTSKLTNSTGNELDGKGNNKRTDRFEERNNSRRMGKTDRPNSEHLDRQRDSGPPNFNFRGGSSGMSQEAGLSRDCRIMTGDPGHFQNGDIEHKRTGPIKPANPSCPPNREPHPKRNTSNNQGPKRRSGQGKGQGPRGPEKSHMVEQAWKPGDQCLALYWEDSKVCLSLNGNKAIVYNCWNTSMFAFNLL